MNCYCCYHTIKDGKRVVTTASYRWTVRYGTVVNLCPECCASWRKYAAEDQALAPRSIVSIR
jgi:hypothetical protein